MTAAIESRRAARRAAARTTDGLPFEHDDAGAAFGPAERMLVLALLTIFAVLGLTVTVAVIVLVYRLTEGFR